MPRPSARERRARLPEIHGLEIIDIADKGRGIARHEGQVVFVEKAVPGDVCSAQLTRQKKAFAEGVATTFSKLSLDKNFAGNKTSGPTL